MLEDDTFTLDQAELENGTDQAVLDNRDALELNMLLHYFLFSYRFSSGEEKATVLHLFASGMCD